MFDLQVPFFIPLWRRVVTVGLTLGWAGFEVLNGAPAWGLLFCAAGLYCVYQFFVIWDPKEEED
ncbi:MAG TPA: hypothetical protein DIU07_16230 [Rhodobacteraceae bacterium]|nr:hypothetical protein [Paracoccaceae bacterium]